MALSQSPTFRSHAVAAARRRVRGRVHELAIVSMALPPLEGIASAVSSEATTQP